MTELEAKVAEFRNILAHSAGLPGDDARRVAVGLWKENQRLRAALIAVDRAYCGVGDFEGTGENMVGVIFEVRQALATNQPTEGKQDE